MISLIVTSSGDRHNEITRLLNSLNDQVFRDFEIIYIDQSGRELDDDLHAKFHGLNIRKLNTGKLSLSKARNLGLDLAKGDIVGFPDDDCWYNNGVLCEVDSYLKNECRGFVCFNVKDPSNNKILGKWRDRGGGSVQIGYKNIFKYPISVGIFTKNNNDLRFDENLGAGNRWGSGEETDYVFRLLEAGNRGKFIPNIFVYHPVIENAFQSGLNYSKSFSYGCGFGATCAKFFQNGYIGVLSVFFNVLLRSIAGIIVCCLRSPSSASSYYARLTGSVLGLLEGLSFYSKRE